VHAVLEEHDTAVKPTVGGVASTDQLLPSQRSTNGTRATSSAGGEAPTAMHAVAEEHDTPVKLPYTPAGVGCIDQRLPSQRSTNGTSVPPAGV
jgi:hypothetical protein